MLLSSSASINGDGLRLEFAYANDGRCKKGTTDLCLFFYISALLPKELQRVGDLDVSDAVLEVADARQVTQLLYDDGRELTRRTLNSEGHFCWIEERKVPTLCPSSRPLKPQNLCR